MDGYDEELEMELEDRHLDEVSAGSADGAALAAQKEARRTYFRELFRLQTELVKLQDWVVATGHKVVILFEGRDAAGKGGAIKRITQRLNPRVCRVAALPAPNDRERTQWYFQRYAAHLPAAGEMVLFDRSWYNRAGVEHVMGFCTPEEHEKFLEEAPLFEKGIVAKHQGGSLPSMPHIEMTVDMLRDFGATVEVDSDKQSWSVKPGALHGKDLVIEPDLSNAAPFLSLAMVCGGSVTIADWPKVTTQPGDQLRSILTAMGATVSMSDAGLTLKGSGTIHGIDIDLHDVGELTPSIAALAALADSPSHLRGIGHLRLHETDRLAALTREINALGGDVVEEESALHITPAPLHGGVFHTYDDHRLATAGAVLGLVVPGIEVENIATTRKTLPDFPGLWSSLLV